MLLIIIQLYVGSYHYAFKISKHSLAYQSCLKPKTGMSFNSQHCVLCINLTGFVYTNSQLNRKHYTHTQIYTEKKISFKITDGIWFVSDSNHFFFV